MTYWGCWLPFGTQQLQATDPNGFKFEHLAGLYDKLIPSFWVFSPSDLDYYYFFLPFNSLLEKSTVWQTLIDPAITYFIHEKKASEFLTISIWQHCFCEATSNKIANINSGTCSPTYRYPLWVLNQILNRLQYMPIDIDTEGVITAIGPSPLFFIWLHLRPRGYCNSNHLRKKQELLNFSKGKASISQGSATG